MMPSYLITILTHLFHKSNVFVYAAHLMCVCSPIVVTHVILQCLLMDSMLLCSWSGGEADEPAATCRIHRGRSAWYIL